MVVCYYHPKHACLPTCRSVGLGDIVGSGEVLHLLADMRCPPGGLEPRPVKRGAAMARCGAVYEGKITSERGVVLRSDEDSDGQPALVHAEYRHSRGRTTPDQNVLALAGLALPDPDDLTGHSRNCSFTGCSRPEKLGSR